jgi:hypothetical protein
MLTVRDYNWLGAGGGFPLGVDRTKVQPFMANVQAAVGFLDAGVDPAGWRAAGTVDALYLVLMQDESLTEPDVTTEGRPRDGVQTYTISYHWLTDESLHPERGPWHLAGVLMLVLEAIADDGMITLPRLSPVQGGGAPGGPTH